MSMIKKLLALTLALAMVLSVSAFAGYSADTYADAADIDADCEDAIELLYALNIMKGEGDNFNPKGSVTRAQMAKMIYVILNEGEDDNAYTYTGAKLFSDVQAGAWYEGYVNYAGATKLVQGRPDGTFGPDEAVTTAEAAKMLLTAIGYSAEARGYVGANWDRNVLNDASIIGLLNGYNTNVYTYAPRQWVAVMVVNALEALTFEDMVPSFNGLLISGNETGTAITMMEKYLKATIVEGTMTSANEYIIAGDKVADDGEVVIDGVVIEADATIEDLGQKFKAIVVDGEAISLRNTGVSVVAEDEVKDVSYELTYATSSNKANNKYEFTVADLTGKLNDGEVNVLNVVSTGDGEYVPMDAEELKDEIRKAGTRNDVVRAIDVNDDGDIDYVIYTPVEYAAITKTGTSQKYGEYVKAVKADGEAVEFEGGSNLYLDDCIICEDELEVGNYVKATWNIDEEMWNVEVLPVEEAIEFESRKNAKNEYTFGGETYNIADNAFENMTNLTTGGLGDDFDIVVDGDLLVFAVETDGNYKSMDEVNAKLAVLIKADVRNTDDENDKQVKLLTIDGETAWYAYNVSGARKANTDDKDNILAWSEIVEDDIDNETNTEWDQLVIVHTNSSGEVYLEKLEDDKDLNLPTELVDVVDNDAAATLKVTDSSAKLNGNKLAADNQFFAKIDDEYTVVTVEDLVKGTYSGIEAQALINEGSYYDTVVGGYLKIDDADPTTAEGFLFILDIAEKETEDESTIYVMFNDEEATEAEIEVTNALAELEQYGCYYYEVTSGEYTLTNVWDRAEAVEVGADSEGTLWYGKNNAVDLSDYEVYALKTVIYERTLVDGEWEWVATETIVEFVDADELTEAVVECVDSDETNNYVYSVNEDADEEALYVQIDVEMNANQY